MSSVGKISLDLNVNSKNFNKQVDGIQKQTTKSFGIMSVAIGNIFADMATRAVAGIGNFVKDSINKGSEIAELQNVVDSVFTTMADKVEDFSQRALSEFGLTEAQSKKMVGTYGAMSKAFGYTEQQAFDMSAALTGLTADVASFYNLDHDVAYTKLKSVFTGETESLKELGVVMTQAALDQFAMAKGFAKTTKDMSEQEKVALRFAFVQDKLSVASGDFLKTQDQWANQTRILSGQFDSLKAALGQGFINVLTPVIRTVNTLMAKLVQLANLFKDFTARLMGVKSGGSGGAGAAMAEVADAADSAAASTGGIEKAAGGAAKAAKEAKKSLMGFDEINKLTPKNDSSGSGDAAAMLGDLGDIGLDNTTEQAEKETIPVLEKLKNQVNELIELFTSGFKSGLGDDFEASLGRIKEHIQSIKTDLKDVFGDADVKASASNWVKTVVYSLGQALGSVTSVVQTIGELLVGGIDDYLSNNKDRLKQSLIGILDVSAEYWVIAGNLVEAIASIFEAFRGDTAKSIVGDLLAIIINANLGMVELALKAGRDIINCIAQPIIENKDLIKNTLEGILQPISVIVDTVANSVAETFDRIHAVYDEKVQPMFQSFADGLSELVTVLLNAFNEHIQPVLTRWGALFKETWEMYVQPMINNAINFIGKLANAIKELWERFLQPLIAWIIETIVPVIAPIIEKLGSIIITLFGTISQIVSGVIEMLGGLIDFIVGVFTGDWSLAWDGIKSIFKGVWTAIEGIVRTVWHSITYIIEQTLNIILGIVTTVMEAVKYTIQTAFNIIKNVITTVVTAVQSVITNGFNGAKNAVFTALDFIKDKVTSVFNGIWSFMKGIINTILGGIDTLVNGVIDGFNSMINALNSLKFTIPEWVPGYGGKSFGLNLSKLSNVKIPRLAEGGYLRANQPTLAVVGDNKTQGEIVSPEGKMYEVMTAALESFFRRLMSEIGGSNQNTDAGDIIIPIYLDGTLLDEVIVTAQQRRALRSGGV